MPSEGAVRKDFTMMIGFAKGNREQTIDGVCTQVGLHYMHSASQRRQRAASVSMETNEKTIVSKRPLNPFLRAEYNLQEKSLTLHSC